MHVESLNWLSFEIEVIGEMYIKSVYATSIFAHSLVNITLHFKDLRYKKTCIIIKGPDGYVIAP